MAEPVRPAVTGLILAGGAARRLQALHPHADKGLLPLAGRPLAAWVLDNLGPQTDRLLISANRNQAAYRRLGHPVLPDRLPGLPGPLAGIHAALSVCTTDWLAVAACDTPFLPPDWVARLLAAHSSATGPAPAIRFACDPQQPHPLVAVVHRHLLPALDSFLKSGNHRVRQWYGEQGAQSVCFDDAHAFMNLNTPADWQQAEARLAAGPPPAAQAPGQPAPRSWTPAPPGPIYTRSAPPGPHHGAGAAAPRRPSPAMTDTALDHAPLACLDTLLRQNPDLDPGALTVAQARALLIRWVPSPAGQEAVPLAAAHHRVLATELRAPFDQPPHDHAAMDGYAMRHADLAADGPSTLPVAGRTLAGDAPATLPPGQAWRIMTGAIMPAGADTVIMQEQVRTPVATPSLTFPASITIPPGQQPGQNVRRRGEDLQQGAVALPAGTLLSAVPLGVAASLGLSHVPVFGPLRVGVFSTGNELVQGDQPRAAGQIHDSNRPTLLALMAERGWQALDLGTLPDDPARLGQALQQAARQVDVLLTSGGAAGGDADLLHPVLSQLADGQAHALRLRLRPGRPLLVGRIGQTPLFGLPGNPVAATLSFLLVVQDALHTMAGTRPRPLPQIRARLGVPLGKRPGRMELVRVRLAGPGPSEASAPSDPAGDDVPALPVAHPTGNQSSALLRSLFEADGIAVLPEAQGPLAAGDLVDVMPLHGLLAG